MKQQNSQRTEDKKLLKGYLNQYYFSRIKRQQLERRLRNIHREMDTPIGGYGYTPVNYGGTNRVSDSTAAFTYRIGEVETRIEEQRKRTEEALLKVMDIIDLFGEDSAERMILELRFIDCRKWSAIAEETHLSKRTCFRYYDKALEKLLESDALSLLLEKK